MMNDFNSCFHFFSNGCFRRRTGGKLLADRGLARHLKKEWPRALEELGASKSDAIASCNNTKPHLTSALAAFINDIDANEIYHRNHNNVDENGDVCSYASNDDAYVVLRNAAVAGGNGNVSFRGSAGISTIYIQSLYDDFWAAAAAFVYAPMNYPPG
jgi:hypothetical protein